MEIKSSLLNDKDFAEVKRSLIKVSEVDGKENFRVKMIEYINESADNNNDMFFYDMLEFTRFLMPDNDAVAYTTPEKLIFMNAPGKIGESRKQWDFIYCHECLHQLWDTFRVGDKLKKEGVEYDHYILNIASDCIINDYLAYYRKKESPSGLITPEFLKEKFGVDYDRKYDTQYTLYLKLLEKKDEIKNDQETQDMMDDQNQGQGGSGSDSNSQKPQQGGNKSKQDNKDSKQSSGEGGDESKDGDEGAGSSNKEGEKDKDGKSGSKDGKEDSEGGDDKKDASGKSGKEGDKGDKESDKDDDSKKSGNIGTGSGDGEGHSESDVDITKITKKANDIIERYKKKISGDFGNFVKKCKSSFEMNKSGLGAQTQKGGASWNEQMSVNANSFVKKKIYQKKRQYESTYTRVKRGSGFVEFGRPIEQGRRIREQKLTINAAFYIDRSGSMGGSIDNVFNACYTIAESLKKQFGKDKIVEDVAFKVYAFNMSMKEIKYGNKCNADGGTMPFHDILKFMSENTKEYMINIIITDAQFDVNPSEVKKFINGTDGMIQFITNYDNQEMKKLSKEYKDKLYYILADSEFKI